MRLVATRVAALEQPEDAAIAGLGDQGQGRAARAELALFRDTGLLRSILDRRRFGITGGDESIWLHVDAAQLLSSSSDMASAPDCIKVVDDRAYRSTESTMLGNLACLCGIWKAAKQCPPKSGESDGLPRGLDADDANAVTGWLRELSKGLEDAGRWLDEEVWQSTGTVPREQIIEAFEEFLNLPLWRHRWLLYEIWILAASIQAAISQGWVCQLHLEREVQITWVLPVGPAQSPLATSAAMGELMFNPFEPVVLDRIDVDVRVEYRRDVAEIIGVSLPGQEVHAGDTVPLRVTLRPYAGPEYVETVPVVIPRTVAGEVIKIEVASGAQVRPDVPQAEIAGRLHRQHAQVLRRPPRS